VFLFQQDNALVTQLSFCAVRRETPQFISRDMWPAIRPDLNPADYRIWGMLQGRVYRVPLCDTDDLRKRLGATWAEFQHRVMCS